MMKSRRNFDATKYLIDMLNKWSEKITAEETQPLILDVAFSYWKSRYPEKAIDYFLRAIKIDPQSRCLTVIYCSNL